MTQHYFTSNPQSAHDERAIQVELAGVRADFCTDAGVFSRDGLDFGSRLLIETVHPLPRGGLGPGLVLMAARNARQNGVSAETLVSDGYENIAPSFDAIVTNPPIRAGKQTVYRILDEAKTRLAPGGRLFLVIRKEQGAPSAQTHLQGVYSRVELLARKKGYWILACE